MAVYAKWNINTYTVTYTDSQFSNTFPDSTSMYTFNGWKMGSTTYGVNDALLNLTTTNNGEVTLNPTWTDGGVTLPNPTHVGYTFVGWYTTSTFDAGTK